MKDDAPELFNAYRKNNLSKFELLLKGSFLYKQCSPNAREWYDSSSKWSPCILDRIIDDIMQDISYSEDVNLDSETRKLLAKRQTEKANFIRLLVKYKVNPIYSKEYYDREAHRDRDSMHNVLNELCYIKNDTALELLKLFIAAGAKLTQAHYRSDPIPLIEACRYNNLPAVKLLVEANINQGQPVSFSEAIAATSDSGIHAYLNSMLEPEHTKSGIQKNNVGDYRGALADFDTALSLNPKNAVVFNHRGFAKYNLGEYRRAIVDYDEAVRLDPNYAAAFNNRGLAKQHLADYRGAVADYDMAITLQKNYAEAFYHRGLAKNAMDDLPSAAKDYEKALQLNNNNYPDASRALALVNTRIQEAAVKRADEAQLRETEEKARKQQTGQIKLTEFKAQLNDIESARQALTASLLSVQGVTNYVSSFFKEGPTIRSVHQAYQELEAEALQLRSVDYYVSRGHFYETTAQQEKNAVRQEALYNNALQDYRRAMSYDPFVDTVVERIEAIAALLNPSHSPIAGSAVSNNHEPARATVLTREALTPEQLAELERIKAELRKQQSQNTSKPS